MGSAGFEPTSSGIFVYNKTPKPPSLNQISLTPHENMKIPDTNPTVCEWEPYGLKGLFDLYVEVCVISAPYVSFVI